MISVSQPFQRDARSMAATSSSTAPHSTQPVGFQNPRYGHCWQGADVMCYLEDSGAKPRQAEPGAGSRCCQGLYR